MNWEKIALASTVLTLVVVTIYSYQIYSFVTVVGSTNHKYDVLDTKIEMLANLTEDLSHQVAVLNAMGLPADTVIINVENQYLVQLCIHENYTELFQCKIQADWNNATIAYGPWELMLNMTNVEYVEGS